MKKLYNVILEFQVEANTPEDAYRIAKLDLKTEDFNLLLIDPESGDTFNEESFK